MKINRDLMKADGFRDQEIDKVQAYCDSAKASKTFSHAAAVLRLRQDSGITFVCRTVAEIVDQLRPGVWLDKSEHQKATDPSGESGGVKTSHRLVVRGAASCSVNDSTSDAADDKVGGEALIGVEKRTRKGTKRRVVKIHCPDFDAFQGQTMVVPFIFRDGHVGSLEGTCRGFGAICPDGKRHEETIGVYTTDGDYLNIRVDLRVTCAIPTFMIGEKEFYYPVVACLTIGCKVDPMTGVMLNPLV